MQATDLNVLVVDDFSTMRRILHNHLKRFGAGSIFQAPHGKAAIDILRSETIDLIISDWTMPVMNGFELLKTVRHDESLKHIPFIMVTAEGQEGHITSAIKEKVSQYLTKPFTYEMLVQKIQQVLV